MTDPLPTFDPHAIPPATLRAPRQSAIGAAAASQIFITCLDQVGMMVLDAGGLIVSWNAGAERLTGFTAGDMTGRDFGVLYSGECIAAGVPEFDLKQALCKKMISTAGWRMRKTGPSGWLGWSVYRLLDHRDRLCGYGVLMQESVNQSGLAGGRRHAQHDDLTRAQPNQLRTGALMRANAMLQSEVADRRRIERELLQSQTLLRELAGHQDQIKEDERKRIAREIHDDLGQNLLALRLDASMLLARSGASHPRLSEKVAGSLRHLDAIMTAVRAIINNLRPGVLDFGLHAAIEWQVKEFQRRSGIVCEVLFDRQECEIDDYRATALFRILQESLTNINRHAQATRVNIMLRRDDQRLSLSIADNGIGIRPGCRRKVNSFGLVGIAERISRLGGELAIDSACGRGTILRMTIPMVDEFCPI